jgi:hypothetical protein
MQGRDLSTQVPRSVARNAAGPSLTVEEVLSRIEDSFQAAKQPPVHPRKPHLKALQVLPVLPNTECWENSYVTACSVDTMLNILDFPGTTPQEREELLERSLLRSYDMRTIFVLDYVEPYMIAVDIVTQRFLLAAFVPLHTGNGSI